jgi:hypothetical protein
MAGFTSKLRWSNEEIKFLRDNYLSMSSNAAGMSFLNIRSYERRDFYNLMYQNATIFLNRKHSLMKESLEYGNAKEIA